LQVEASRRRSIVLQTVLRFDCIDVSPDLADYQVNQLWHPHQPDSKTRGLSSLDSIRYRKPHTGA
jgi:hypothetical protein